MFRYARDLAWRTVDKTFESYGTTIPTIVISLVTAAVYWSYDKHRKGEAIFKMPPDFRDAIPGILTSLAVGLLMFGLVLLVNTFRAGFELHKEVQSQNTELKDKVQTLEKQISDGPVVDLTRPRLAAFMFDHPTFGLDDQDHLQLAVQVVIKNSGAQSIVSDFSVELSKKDGTSERLEIVLLRDQTVTLVDRLLDGRTSRALVTHQDLLVVKSIKAIESGGSLQGWLLCRAKDDAQLDTAMMLTLRFKDVLDRPYQADALITFPANVREQLKDARNTRGKTVLPPTR